MRDFPDVFLRLQTCGCVTESDTVSTDDGFFMIRKSLSDILAEKDIRDFPAAGGKRLACDKFYDDWFLYAVSACGEHTYSLLKMREQEHDLVCSTPSDGDTPGVTVSFIAFDCTRLIDCLDDPTDENRQRLDSEINRTVSKRGERHHKRLKKYFTDPRSDGAYLAAQMYTLYIASFAENGAVKVSDHYRALAVKSSARLPRFIEALNREAGHTVCDGEKIYIRNKDALTEYERAAILATHTGNTSEYSFAAEVEYHARFLTLPARIKIPFFGRSVYDSAVRADMTVENNLFDLSAPFYRANSKIVKRQLELHRDKIHGDNKH